jgi:hypothetical protein
LKPNENYYVLKKRRQLLLQTEDRSEIGNAPEGEGEYRTVAEVQHAADLRSRDGLGSAYSLLSYMKSRQRERGKENKMY